MKLIARQGDIGVIAIDAIPEDAFERKDKTIIAHSDLTGHTHRISRAKLFELDGKIYAKVSSKAVLSHDEHGPINIEKGIYEIRPQREMTLLDEVRQVVD